MKLKINKLATISTILISSLSIVSCDSDDDNSTSFTPDTEVGSGGGTGGSNEDNLGVEIGDIVRMVFSGGDSSIVAQVTSETHANYVFSFGDNDIQVGNIPFTFSESGSTKSYNATPTSLTDAESVNAINELIQRNSQLSNLLQNANNLNGSEIREILKIITESIADLTLSFDGEFFIVRTADLVAVGSSGTFTETGSTLTFTSTSVALEGGQTNLVENPTVTFE